MTEPVDAPQDPPRNTGRTDDPTRLDADAAPGSSEELPVVQGLHLPDVPEVDHRD